MKHELIEADIRRDPHYLLGKAEGLLIGWLDPDTRIKRAEDATRAYLKSAEAAKQ